MDAEAAAAADLWNRTLNQIPTLFGRLVYLSSLRNPNTNSYFHYGLSIRFGDRASRAAIKQSHGELLRQWLVVPLAERKADLHQYLRDLELPVTETVGNWRRLRPYAQYVAGCALPGEKKHFMGDLEFLLEIIEKEIAAATDPGASRPS